MRRCWSGPPRGSPAAGSARWVGRGSAWRRRPGAGTDVARIAHAVRELGLERARALGTFAFERFEAEFRAPEALA